MKTVEKLRSLGFEVKELETKDNFFQKVAENYISLKVGTGKGHNNGEKPIP